MSLTNMALLEQICVLDEFKVNRSSLGCMYLLPLFQ